MMKRKQKLENRKRRTRDRVRGTAERPRVSVYRSLTGMSVQLIDDVTGKTLVSGRNKSPEELGAQVAKQAESAGLTTVVFDRSGYIYHGRVKQLADALRNNGLKF